jgi:hypothetical protein
LLIRPSDRARIHAALDPLRDDPRFVALVERVYRNAPE